ncbi:unnamed protein product, partial [Urochloa humidicola]
AAEDKEAALVACVDLETEAEPLEAVFDSGHPTTEDAMFSEDEEEEEAPASVQLLRHHRTGKRLGTAERDGHHGAQPTPLRVSRWAPRGLQVPRGGIRITSQLHLCRRRDDNSPRH